MMFWFFPNTFVERSEQHNNKIYLAYPGTLKPGFRWLDAGTSASIVRHSQNNFLGQSVCANSTMVQLEDMLLLLLSNMMIF